AYCTLVGESDCTGTIPKRPVSGGKVVTRGFVARLRRSNLLMRTYWEPAKLGGLTLLLKLFQDSITTALLIPSFGWSKAVLLLLMATVYRCQVSPGSVATARTIWSPPAGWSS